MADKYARDETMKIFKGELTAPAVAFKISTNIVNKSWQCHWDRDHNDYTLQLNSICLH